MCVVPSALIAQSAPAFSSPWYRGAEKSVSSLSSQRYSKPAVQTCGILYCIVYCMYSIVLYVLYVYSYADLVTANQQVQLAL